MLPNLFSGAKCKISFNGTVVAAGFVADWTIETRATEIETIDQVVPAELAPDRVRVALNMRVYRTPDNDPILGDIAPGSASLGAGEQKAFTQSRYLYIEVKDNNDKTIFHIPKAWILRRSSSLSMGEFLSENWSVLGIGYVGPTS